MTSVTGQIIEADSRGKHTNRPKRIKDEVINSVRKHIESYQRIDSHYCRASTSRQYLSANLSVKEMYRQYVVKMEKLGQVTASKHYYRDVFANEYNLGFHQPKKDQCDQCAAFDNLTPQEKIGAQRDQDQHLKNKNIATELVRTDKQAAIGDSFICCASFDLQKVLYVPGAPSSTLYYKRKLSIYNFTIYDLATEGGRCFVWNKTTGKRRANEIASCVWKFIQIKIAEGCNEFRFYTDNCGGQNRNSILYIMYQKASLDLGITITHR